MSDTEEGICGPQPVGPIPSPQSPVRGSQAARHGEGADDYPFVVAQLNRHWRVVASTDKPPYRQWILQQSYRRGEVTEWRSHSFCQARETLLRGIRQKITQPIYKRAKAQAIDLEALATIEALPERIGAREEGDG